MRDGQFLTRAGWAAALLVGFALVASPAWGQNNNNNNNGGGGGGIGQLPAGVLISADGVLRLKQFTDPTGQLTKMRLA